MYNHYQLSHRLLFCFIIGLLFLTEITRGQDKNASSSGSITPFNAAPTSPTPTISYNVDSTRIIVNLTQPASGVAYLQTSPTGTSTSIAAPLTITTPGTYTYYGRTLASGSWISASPGVTFTVRSPMAQTTYRGRTNYIFRQLDLSPITTGLLLDYGMEFTSVGNYNGALSDSNQVDIYTWRKIYASLQTSRVNGLFTLPTLDMINTRMDSYFNRSVTNLAMIHMNYQTLKPNAVSSNLLRVVNNQLLDVAGRTQTPYDLKTAFAVTSSRAVSQDGKARFIFRPELFFSNTGKTVQRIEVDFSDGRGYMSVNWNTVIAVNYSSAGNKLIRYRFTFTDSTIAQSQSWFGVAKVTASARWNLTSTDTLRIDTVRFAPTANHSGGTVYVWYSNRRNGVRQIVKPLIVAEGIDFFVRAPKLLEDQGNWGLTDLMNFMNSENARWPLPNPISNATTFVQALDDVAGYDLIFIDYRDGADDIRRNAALVQEVIAEVNRRKVNAPNGQREQNVVMGLSMGGLVARYALCNMAETGIATDTRLFISHDAPHRGANIPLGFQAMIRDVDQISSQIGIPLRLLVPELRDAMNMLNAPATRQLLIYQDGITNTFLDGEYRTKINRIIPGCRIIATSLGAQCAQPQTIAPGAELLNVGANFYASSLIFYLAAGTLLATAGPLVTLVPVVGQFLVPLAAIPAVAVAVAGLVIGNKNWKVDFVVNALPNRQQRRIFYGRFGFEKRLLFLIPINITIWQSERVSTTAMLPIDSAPGSLFFLGQDQIGAFTPANPNINRYPIISVNVRFTVDPTYCFVPVASALDVPNLSTGIEDRFVGGLSPSSNTSRFGNFIAAEPGPGNEFNRIHIIFTARNSQWMYYEMEGRTDNTFNCQQINCSAPQVSISGSFPAFTCGTVEGDFSVPNPNRLAYTWTTSSSTLVVVSGQGTANVRLRRIGNCNGCTITATPVGNSCPVVSRTLDVSNGGGGYSSSDYPVTGPDQATCGQTVYYQTVSLPGATNYQWVNIPSGATNVSGQGTRYLSFTVPTNTFGMSVGVRVATTCDAGGSPAMKFTSVSCSNGFRIFPNPPSSELTVERILPQTQDVQALDVQTNEELMSTDTKEPVPLMTVKLLNYYNETVASGKVNGAKIQLNVSRLPTGIYYLQAQYGDQPVVTQQVVIVR